MAYQLTSVSKRRIVLRIGNSFIPVAADDVAVFYSDRRITYAIDFNGRKYRIRHPIIHLKQILGENRFFRVSRKMIINIAAIREYSRIPFGKLSIVLISDSWISEAIVVSQTTAPIFKKWITGDHPSDNQMVRAT